MCTTMRLAGCLILLLMIGETNAQAESWRRPLQGGLIGGATGALISRSSEIDSRVAIPALAFTGAMIGFGHERGWFDRSRDDRYYIEYGWPTYPHAYTRHSYPYSHGYDYGAATHRPGRWRRGASPVVTRERLDQELSRRDARHLPAERHPGVAVEHVAVPLPNGVTVNVRLVKLHDRYVGPRGETYAEMPSADTLLRRMLGHDQ